MMINKWLIGTVSKSKKYIAGNVALQWCALAADFFLPMRQLGSYFHIAMNGMAVSDKIFRLLDLPEPSHGTMHAPAAGGNHLPGAALLL